MHTSSLVNQLKPSETLAAAARARELRAKGIDVLEFTVGEPDFITPAHIREAARKAMDAGFTRYTAATGIPELKKAICDAFLRDHGVTWKPSEVTVSNGAKHCLHNVLVACCEPGDEVIIPTPYWVSYSALVELTGAKPVLVETREQDGFCLSAAQFRAAITPRTRMLMLNSPSNPTGGVYPVAALQALAEVAVEKDIIVLSDEIYDKLIYPGHEFRSFAALGEEVRKRTVIVNGVSKAYAMTGWRIGWTLAPENAKPADLKPLQCLPVCRFGGTQRSAGVRSRDVSGVCETTRLRLRSPEGHSWTQLCRARRSVLRILQRGQLLRSPRWRWDAGDQCHRFLHGPAGSGSRSPCRR
jgi:aspartate aminotransferase